MSFEFFLRVIVFIVIATCIGYWKITEIQADAAKQKKQSFSFKAKIKKLCTTAVYVVIVLQLAGLQFLPLETTTIIKTLGVIMVLISGVSAIIARRELGNNWTHGAEYQIKQKHNLVVSGIYSYIRHPIYIAMLLLFLGTELVIGSYLFFIFLIIFPYIAYTQAKREESLLIQHFEDEYKVYMQKTRMFIPYIV